MKRVIATGLFLVACACGERGNVVPTATPLSPDGGRYLAPSYSPDGSRIAYWMSATEGAAGWELWISKADFSGAVKVPVTLAAFFSPSPAEWSPDGRRLAVGSSDFGMLNVVIVAADGGPAQRLTKSTGVEIPIAWDRDGDHLYYLATAGASFAAFKVSTKTGAVSAAVPGEKRPYIAVLSPDGAHVAFFTIDGGKTTIWVADTTGANARQLTTEGFESFSPGGKVWSPDSKEIVYESRRTGTTDVWVAPIDGTKPRQLTHDVRNDFASAWSPDGKTVAFISDRGRQTDVWVVPSAGGTEQRVTDTAVSEGLPLQWRPQSNDILFETRLDKGAIWSVDVASGLERQLTPDSVRAGWFNVSPKGGEFNYVAERGSGAFDLVVAPLDGGPSRTLVTGTGTVWSPRWSWDGTKIVFSSDRGGSSDVWVVEVAGGAARALVTWPGAEQNAVWNHDGSTVLFDSDRDSRLQDVWSVPSAGGEPKRLTADGSTFSPGTQPGVKDVVVGIYTRDGRLGISRLGVDGTLHIVWDKSNSFPGAMSPRGDSLIAVVEQPDAKKAHMLLSMKTGAGRTILKDGDLASGFSPDAKFLSYTTKAGGGQNLALLNLGDGTTRVLTKGSDEVSGTEFTPDGKTLVFRRSKIVQRLVTVDATRLLTGGK